MTSPDNVLISGVLENGAVASVHVATVPSHGSGWRLEVHGKEGTLIASSRLMVQYAQILLRGAKRKESLKELPHSGKTELGARGRGKRRAIQRCTDVPAVRRGGPR